jgi:hypothetical protein
VTQVDLGAEALASLVPISIVIGIGILLVFRHTSDQAAVRRARNLVTAHLLEFRLFMDEPRLILRAQRNLIVANIRLLRLMLRPVLVLALPTVVLLAGLDGFYGRAPLVIGEAAIVTAQVKHDGTVLVLKTPPEMAAETSGIRVPAGRQVSWRIRPLRASTGDLELVHQERVFRKSFAAGAGRHYCSERRGSIAGLLLHPAEAPIIDSEIEWIEVRYPNATILHLHWLIWFFVISGFAALVLKGRLRTAF